MRKIIVILGMCGSGKSVFSEYVTPKYNNRIFTVKYDNDNNIKLIANRGRPKKIS